MHSNRPFLCLAAFLSVAACSRQAPPEAASVDFEDREPAPAVVAEQPKPVYDYEKLAGGMLMLIADAPECQKYRDELQAIASLPMGATAEKDPAKVVAAAHDAGCSTKSRLKAPAP